MGQARCILADAAHYAGMIGTPSFGPSFWRRLVISVCACLATGWSVAHAEGPLLDSAGTALAQVPPSEAAAMERIRRDLNWLADDAREGRLTGSEGYDAAAAYVADQMDRIGLRPGGPDGWRQPVPLVRMRRVMAGASLKIADLDGATPPSFAAGADFAPGVTPSTEAACEAEAVFVGLGVSDPLGRWDDLHSADLTGKAVIVVDGAPQGFHEEERAHLSSRRVKAENLARRGAECVLFVRSATAATASSWKTYAARVGRRSSTTWTDATRAWLQVPTAVLSRQAGARLLNKLGGMTLLESAATAALSNGPLALRLRVSLAIRTNAARVKSANILGVLPGANSKGEGPSPRPVVVTAHLDHLGVGDAPLAKRTTEADRAATPSDRIYSDRIYNGAMDNAMGVALMLEAARAVAARPIAPRRDILFVAVTAEETGLNGSDYLASRLAGLSVCPAANVNLDMSLTLFPIEDIAALGARRSTIGVVAAAAAASEGLALGDGPALNLFARSDHFSFVRRGAPAAFLFVGVAGRGQKAFEDFMKDNYHLPTDEVGGLPIDYASALKVANVARRMIEALADADHPPRWVQGDYFGAIEAPCNRDD